MNLATLIIKAFNLNQAYWSFEGGNCMYGGLYVYTFQSFSFWYTSDAYRELFSLCDEHSSKERITSYHLDLQVVIIMLISFKGYGPASVEFELEGFLNAGDLISPNQAMLRNKTVTLLTAPISYTFDAVIQHNPNVAFDIFNMKFPIAVTGRVFFIAQGEDSYQCLYARFQSVRQSYIHINKLSLTIYPNSHDDTDVYAVDSIIVNKTLCKNPDISWVLLIITDMLYPFLTPQPGRFFSHKLSHLEIATMPIVLFHNSLAWYSAIQFISQYRSQQAIYEVSVKATCQVEAAFFEVVSSEGSVVYEWSRVVENEYVLRFSGCEYCSIAFRGTRPEGAAQCFLTMKQYQLLLIPVNYNSRSFYVRFTGIL